MEPSYTPVLSREDMRELDRVTIEAGTASIDLMERAGEQIRDFLLDRAASPLGRLLETERAPRVLILAGPGNNGGDGFVVARLLAAEGWDAIVARCAAEPSPESDGGVNLRRWRDLGGTCIETTEDAIEALASKESSPFDLVIDALFGTGLTRPLEGDYLDLVSTLNGCGLPVLSVDTPSGLCADTGEPLGVAVFADATVTLGAAKPGLFCGVGPNHCGRLVVVDIGLLEPSEAGIQAAGQWVDAAACRHWLPSRHAMTHKGELGHVLVVGGSVGKLGAVLLAARAALRLGAGLVTMAVPETVAVDADARLLEAMTLPLPATANGQFASAAARQLGTDCERFDAIVVGPGMGTERGARAIVGALLDRFHGPLVIDADGLNIIAGDLARFDEQLARRRKTSAGAVVLTPHPGEMGRLLGMRAAAVQEDRLGTLRRFYREHATVTVLKGAATLVGDGRRVGFNGSGNPGMASAGMGDVLAGALGTLVAQKPDPWEAAALAVYLHGLAGDFLAEELGGPGFLASELADRLAAAAATGEAGRRA